MSAVAASAAIRVPRARRRKRIRGSSIAILVFLTMCAAFVSLPLYVVVITSFKTMEQISLGEVFALPTEWTIEPWRMAWSEVCAGMTCEGVSHGFWVSMKILFPSLLLSIGISAVTGYALALW